MEWGRLYGESENLVLCRHSLSHNLLRFWIVFVSPSYAAFILWDLSIKCGVDYCPQVDEDILRCSVEKSELTWVCCFTYSSVLIEITCDESVLISLQLSSRSIAAASNTSASAREAAASFSYSNASRFASTVALSCSSLAFSFFISSCLFPNAILAHAASAEALAFAAALATEDLEEDNGCLELTSEGTFSFPLLPSVCMFASEHSSCPCRSMTFYCTVLFICFAFLVCNINSVGGNALQVTQVT